MGIVIETEVTDRELEIIRLLLQYKSYEDIAERLGVTKRTIKWNMANIYRKLNFKSLNFSPYEYRVALLRWAIQNNVVKE